MLIVQGVVAVVIVLSDRVCAELAEVGVTRVLASGREMSSRTMEALKCF